MSFIKSYLSVGVFAATASALCCITPVIAMLGGVSGIAATFAWVEPFRPYLIGITVLALGFAWYQKLKPQSEIDCACDDDKPSFLQGKTFLALITVFAVLMLTFPSYSSIFFRAETKKPELPNTEQTNNQAVTSPENKDEYANVVFVVDGMTCTSCEHHIKSEVSKLEGVSEIKASYKDGKAFVKFDQQKTTVEQIRKAIDSTGYTVKESKSNEK